ncbi:hypothetical protein D9758_008038 [Tetrapyrgos nigripes]|uniref:Uncharacterized protein n=1 Tax=Tetrapyrgos nigripes TaxID=182062 RepID=A0A8H5D148_9AGAR|nr:hypothetical protein D9758_008038 [Tetrapyrgos nigripes]
MLRVLSPLKHHIQNELGWIIRREFSTSQTLLYEKPRILSSLWPDKLTKNDYRTISLLKRAVINYGKVRCADLYWQSSERRNVVRFPAKTSGFFYYHLPTNAPLFAGGLRFRICPSEYKDPKLFHDGSDLLKPNGLPWEVSNWAFALHQKLQPLGEAMVRTNVIRPGALELCNTLASRASLQQHPSNPVVYSFKQPIPMKMRSDTQVHIWIANEEKMTRLVLDTDIIEPFNVLSNEPKGGAAHAHICFDLEGDELVLRLLSVPPEYVGKTKHNVGDAIPYKPPSPNASDILKSFLPTSA